MAQRSCNLNFFWRCHLTDSYYHNLILRWMGSPYEREVFQWIAERTGKDEWILHDGPQVKIAVILDHRKYFARVAPSASSLVSRKPELDTS